MKIATELKEYIKEAEIVEFAVLDSLGLTSQNSLRVILNRLVRQGEIYNPKKGVYVSKDADHFKIATKIYPGYLSLSTALYLHHLVEEHPFTIYVASSQRKLLRLGEHEIQYFKSKNFSGVIDTPYKMAQVEKAIYDCLLHAEIVGYARIAKALFQADISTRKFTTISRNESDAFFQRLGYLLSILPSLDKNKRRLLALCKKKIRSNAYLLGRKKGKHVPEWKIVDNVGKEAILSWWQQ